MKLNMRNVCNNNLVQNFLISLLLFCACLNSDLLASCPVPPYRRARLRAAEAGVDRTSNVAYGSREEENLIGRDAHSLTPIVLTDINKPVITFVQSCAFGAAFTVFVTLRACKCNC